MPRITEPPNLLEPEFDEPFNSWKATPSPENATTLLKSINPVITSALRTYANQSSPTLHSRAKIMALDAMGRYDPSKAKLRTHLMFQLQGLRRYTAKEQQILSVPEQVGLDLNTVRNAENELRDSLGRDPSDVELGDHIHMSPKRLAYIRKAKPSYSEGGQQRLTGDGEDIYAPAVDNRDGGLDQWHEFVYHDLSPIDQVILEFSMGLHNKPILQNKDIARRLNMSPGAISQRKAKIQEKLYTRDELGVL